MKSFLVLLVALNVAVLINGQAATKPDCSKPPNQKKPMDCCKVPNIMPPKADFDTCAQKVPKPAAGTPAAGQPKGQNCIAECMLQKQGIITGGTLSKDAATAKLVAMVGSSADWQKAATTAVNTCYTAVTPMLSQKDSLGCSTAAGTFMKCLPTEVFKNCPASAWTANADCDAQKAFLAKGCPFWALQDKPKKP